MQVTWKTLGFRCCQPGWSAWPITACAECQQTTAVQRLEQQCQYHLSRTRMHKRHLRRLCMQRSLWTRVCGGVRCSSWAWR